MSNRPTIVEVSEDLPDGVTFPNGMAAVDTETMGLNVMRDRLCLVQVGDGEGNVWLVKFEGSNYDAPNLRRLLKDEKIKKLYHYARFDIAVMDHYLGQMSTNNYCTKIVSKLVRTNTEKHGLKTLVAECTGVELDKQEQCSDWSVPHLSEAQKHYAASDVLYLHKIKAYLDERLEKSGRVHLAEACFDFLPTRARLDVLGWSGDIFAHNS